MANKWTLIRVTGGVSQMSSGESETFSYDFPKTTGTSDVVYSLTVTNDDGCTASTSITVPAGSECQDVCEPTIYFGFGTDSGTCNTYRSQNINIGLPTNTSEITNGLAFYDYCGDIDNDIIINYFSQNANSGPLTYNGYFVYGKRAQRAFYIGFDVDGDIESIKIGDWANFGGSYRDKYGNTNNASISLTLTVTSITYYEFDISIYSIFTTETFFFNAPMTTNIVDFNVGWQSLNPAGHYYTTTYKWYDTDKNLIINGLINSPTGPLSTFTLTPSTILYAYHISDSDSVKTWASVGSINYSDIVTCQQIILK